MQILYELRYPTRWYTKLLMALSALVFFAVLATTAIAGFLVYRIVKPQRTSSEINMASFPGRPEGLNFEVPGGLGTREGWFFPGFRAAYAALREAERDKRIRALVVDSVYDEPKQMVKVGVERNGLGGFPFMVRAAGLSFEYLNYAHRDDPPLSQKLLALVGVPTLYIQALDDPELAETTRQMFLKAPEPREQAIIQHGNFVSLNDEEKRAYENRVVSFFLVRLPATGKAVR